MIVPENESSLLGHTGYWLTIFCFSCLIQANITAEETWASELQSAWGKHTHRFNSLFLLLSHSLLIVGFCLDFLLGGFDGEGCNSWHVSDDTFLFCHPRFSIRRYLTISCLTFFTPSPALGFLCCGTGVRCSRAPSCCQQKAFLGWMGRSFKTNAVAYKHYNMVWPSISRETTRRAKSVVIASG